MLFLLIIATLLARSQESSTVSPLWEEREFFDQYASRLAMSQAITGLGAALASGLLIMLAVRSIKKRQRPKFSLGSLLVFVFVLSIGLYGAVRWWTTERPDEVNGYNPVPSPDGSKIAFVRLAWGRPGGSGGCGSSNLITDVMVMDLSGKMLTEKPLADAYLMGWTPDGKNLICFRDWEYFLVDLNGKRSQEHPQLRDDADLKSLHCGFLPKSGVFVWIKNVVADSKRDPDGLVTTHFSGCQVESRSGVILQSEKMLNYVLPSPDEKFLAVFRDVGMYPMKNMWVHDLDKKSWAEFGEITPQPCWGWADAWTPWFPDGSKLILAQDKELLVCTPDGKEKKSIAKMDARAGLPVVSPNGKRVAFVTWSGTARPNPGTTIWVVPADGSDKPQVVVKRFKEDTCGLKWLNDDELVFDRDVPAKGEAPMSRLYRVKRTQK